MQQQIDRQVIHVQGIVNGHLVRGTVTFSPSPPFGILSELAKFEAERIVGDMLNDEIVAGRL